MTAAPVMRPTTANTPSWVSAGNPASSSEANPMVVVSTPSRIVGQIARMTSPAEPRAVRWLNKWIG